MQIRISEDAAAIYGHKTRGSYVPPGFIPWMNTLTKISGMTLDVETDYLFDSQFNTKEIPGVLPRLGVHIAAVVEIIDDARLTHKQCTRCNRAIPLDQEDCVKEADHQSSPWSHPGDEKWHHFGAQRYRYFLGTMDTTCENSYWQEKTHIRSWPLGKYDQAAFLTKTNVKLHELIAAHLPDVLRVWYKRRYDSMPQAHQLDWVPTFRTHFAWSSPECQALLAEANAWMIQHDLEPCFKLWPTWDQMI